MKQPKKMIFNDVWAFYKEYLNCQFTDEDWQEIIKKQKTINDNYHNDFFCRSLTNVVVNEFKHIQKEGKQ